MTRTERNEPAAGSAQSSSRSKGRNKRDRGPPTREVQVSKKLSWLLRHGAEKEGLALGKGGYANLQDVLNTKSIKPLKVTLPELIELVSSNDKQRYSLIPAASIDEETPSIDSISPTDDPSTLLIRANQGHSLKLTDADDLLTPLSLDDPDSIPAAVVHGTTRKAWGLIQTSGGLKKMTRNHVHFARGLPAGFEAVLEEGQKSSDAGKELETEVQTEQEQPPVISGMRSSSTVLIFIDIRKALELGIPFGISANGVVLSEGNGDGYIPVEVFQKVFLKNEKQTGWTLVFQDGKSIEG